MICLVCDDLRCHSAAINTNNTMAMTCWLSSRSCCGEGVRSRESEGEFSKFCLFLSFLISSFL